MEHAPDAGVFRPLPLLGNAHVQTLLGFWLAGPPFDYPAREHFVTFTNGDRMVLHDSIPAGWSDGGPIAILAHGLTGSHRSGYMQRTGRVLLEGGWRVVRLDLRGCGRGEALARRPYHAGCSDDVRAAVEEVYRWSPDSSLALVGFSLGGNIMLKLAGEAAEQPLPGLARVAALAPPIDLERCAALIALRRNRLYDLYFARALMAHARRRERLFPDMPVVRFPRRMSLRLFDDLYTAPVCGFRDALDYYRRSGALPYVAKIRVPTLILTARDDPFVAVEPFESLPLLPQVTVRILERGGHLGFLGRGAPGIRWAESQLTDWLLRSGDGITAPVSREKETHGTGNPAHQ